MHTDATPDHHGSHRNLLWASVDLDPASDIDAIIVPTARRPAYLDNAATLARALSCPLVTLHSNVDQRAGAAQRLQSDRWTSSPST